jgi:hypothetical protein
LAVPDRPQLPFKTGNICRSGSAGRAGLYRQIEFVQVRFPKSTLLDFKKAGALKFFEIRANTALCSAHIIGEFDLSWKARIITPCVLQEHGVCELCSDREFLFCENEIWHLREAMPRNWIGSDELDASLFEEIAYVAV